MLAEQRSFYKDGKKQCWIRIHKQITTGIRHTITGEFHTVTFTPQNTTCREYFDQFVKSFAIPGWKIV